ncbi:MAG: hypothetical protein IJU37_12815 [Desulfovibrio sp.]|nr:hypothetical protein [Desulfovibrio sp.]
MDTHNLVLYNGIGILVMAIFGLWVFYRSAQLGKKKKHPSHGERRPTEDHQE